MYRIRILGGSATAAWVAQELESQEGPEHREDQLVVSCRIDRCLKIAMLVSGPLHHNLFRAAQSHQLTHSPTKKHLQNRSSLACSWEVVEAVQQEDLTFSDQYSTREANCPTELLACPFLASNLDR